MIESCNVKRMLAGIALLGGLTVIVLIFEGNWTNHTGHGIATNLNKSIDCWEKEKFEIIEQCHPCTGFELASNSIDACVRTKFKEVLKCEVSGRVVRSCDKVAWIEEKHYWIFECVMFTIAVLSWFVTYFRQRILDRRVKHRLQKQLASGLAS